MNWKILSFFLLALFSLSAHAQTTISGLVLFGEEDSPMPVPGYPVTIITGDGEVMETHTDDLGYYEASLSLVDGDVVVVELIDMCTGEIITVDLPASDGAYVANFHICVDILPPPPPNGCEAYFGYEQTSVDPYIVDFFNLSYSSTDMISLEWDFGDGSTSNEFNPVHEYANPGPYEVTLQLTADTCSSTYTDLVMVEEEIGCGCPEFYDPVCVATPGGQLLMFSNFCFAECEGYGPDTWIPCEGNCVCDDIYLPVCVVVDGDTITYSNPCFAACDGYGEDSFVDCSDIGPCDCPFEYDPVCVVTPNGDIIQFTNPCLAECAGYGADTFVDCDPDPCICPEIFAPVCVITESGDTLSFTNACFAVCEGFTPDQHFDCDINNPCDCPFIYDPVCVVAPDGIELIFYNACLAECEGYGEDTYVDCSDYPGDCHADFSIDLFVNDQNPLTAQFYDHSFAAEGEVITWLWDFGDGTTSEEQNPTHTFPEEGIYEVTLTIATSEGCTATMVQHICLGEGGPFQGPDCQAIFYFEQSGDNAYTFQFNDLSFGEVTDWFWSFGDGFTSTEQNPVHTYTGPGVYVVALTVTTEACESAVIMILATEDDIIYDATCRALFVPLETIDSNEVFFLNLSSPDAVEHNWDFGDGNTSNEILPAHQYAEGGVYTVTLTIVTADGCANVFSVTLDLDDNEFTGTPQYLIVSDTDETTNKLEVKAFPNPVTKQLTIALDTSIAADYQLDLYSLVGQKQQSQKGQLGAGTQLLTLDMQSLPAGLYLVNIQIGNQFKQLKVVKR